MVGGYLRAITATALGCFAAQCPAGTCGPAYGADGIAEDAAGNVWFTHYEDVRVSTFAASTRKFTEYLPTTRSNPEVTTRAKGSAGTEKFDYAYDAGYSGIGIDQKRKYIWTFRWNSNTLTRFSQRERKFKDFELPARAFARGAIQMDAHGHLWELATNPEKDAAPPKSMLIEVSPEGKVLRQVALPHQSFSGYALALDRQGRAWLAQSGTEADAVAELYVLDGGRFVQQRAGGLTHIVSSMAFDASGNLWLTEYDSNAIAKYSNGQVTTIALSATSGSPGGAIIDGSGNLWFSEHLGDNKPGKIGRVSADGKLTEFDVPPENDWVVTMAAARDGGIWFSTILNYNLFHLDPATGRFREYSVPVPTNWSEDAVSRSSSCTIANKDAVIAEPVLTVAATRHPKGYGRDTDAALFEDRCTRCHTWYRVDKVANRRSDWTPTVDRMIYGNGAKQFINAEDRERIIRYLNGRYSNR